MLDYFSEERCLKWTERSKRRVGRGINIGDKVRVAPLDRLSLVLVSIHRRLFTAKGTALENLAEAHFESAKWAASFETETAKKQVLRDVSNNDVLKSRLREP